MTEKPLTASELAEIIVGARPLHDDMTLTRILNALRAHAKAQERNLTCEDVGCRCGDKPAPQLEPELPTREDWEWWTGKRGGSLDSDYLPRRAKIEAAHRRLARGEDVIVDAAELERSREIASGHDAKGGCAWYKPMMEAEAERDTLKVENARLREAVVEARRFIEPALKTFGGFGTWNVYGIARDFLARTREWA